jgi:hypothetical protein
MAQTAWQCIRNTLELRNESGYLERSWSTNGVGIRMEYDKKQGRRHFWIALAGALAPSMLLGLMVYFNWTIYKAAMLGICG